ncbi:DUF4349 domain-containing protein [Marinicrinis sediminis]|uniref:DUF4349 domain-containing protein n=1 Tax=Marinicrinis sediminis TaxID=1652465 RepID=A0ABW5R981_9BACL
MKTNKWVAILLAAMLLVLAACSSSNDDNASMEYGNADMATDDANHSSKSLSEPSVEAETAGETSADMDVSSQASLGDETAISSTQRSIIYTANVTMEVEDYAAAQSKIRNMVHLSKGYMLHFSEGQTEYENGGTFTLKIPASGFQSFIDQLDLLNPTDLQTRIQGEDVTEEYVDIESRLKAKQVVEARLLSFMETAKSSQDLLSYSKELASIQEEIERLKGRLRYLDQNVSYSTIELRMYEPREETAINSKEEKERPFADKVSEAMTGSLNFLKMFFQSLVIFFAGALPILVVLLIIGIPLFLLLRKYSRSTNVPGNAYQMENQDLLRSREMDGNTESDAGEVNQAGVDEEQEQEGTQSNRSEDKDFKNLKDSNLPD